MGTVYASVEDIASLGIQLTATQRDAAEILLSTASSKLRLVAKKHNVDLDKEVSEDEDYSAAVKSVVIQSVTRALNSISDASPALSQGSEINGSYSIQMTYLNAGQSLYFLRNELKDLGLLRQVYGAIEIYDTEKE
ncbi:Gp19/Gp15/Gp42 family protein [Ruminococcus flavefaciens]|uniref:Gp19/Gp15/Gp42 family protein n=1 Tax=Ruminococcus flavefaciens TaxID=1265 RepID=UPI0026F1BB33|nr:Gp19/Gp15/Gp42 family protein [Ruminococcus flavefaciens]